MFSKNLLSVLFCLLFLGQQSLEAQVQRFSAGVTLGLNAAQIQGDDYAGYNKIGLMTGLLAEIAITEKKQIGIEILYNQLGSRSEYNKDNTNVPFKIKTDYMSIPVYFKYKDWLSEEEGNDDYYKLHFFGGFSYGRLFQTEIESSKPEFVDSQDCYKKNYVGILAGAIFYLNKHWGIGARWERSLLLLYNNNDNCVVNGNPVNHKSLWNKHLSFYVSYAL